MSRDARGQMLLVAGLALAVAFVALALVLNTVVFTENLATRNHDQTDDALGFEAGVEEGVGGLIAEANRHDDSDYASLSSSLQASVTTWDRNATVLAVADGSVTETTLIGDEDGTRIFQTTTRNFTDREGDADWTMAADVDSTRRFVVVATPDSGGTLTVNVSDGTTDWTVEIAEDGSNTTVTAFVDGTQVATSSHATSIVTVDVTEGTVEGDAVDDWTFAENVTAPYNVSIADGDQAEGRYQLFVDRPRSNLLGDLPANTYWAPGDGSFPATAPAIYSADVNVTVRRSTLTYQTTLTVAPESGPWNETLAT